MPSDDIYGMQEPSAPNRRKREAVSQRRDEYLRATGGESVHRQHHHHHGHNHRSSGWKVALLGSGLLALLIAGALWWLVRGR